MPWQVYFVLELCQGGELFDAIVARGSFSEKLAAAHFRTMVQVCHHCHQLGVIHRCASLQTMDLARFYNLVDRDCDVKQGIRGCAGQCSGLGSIQPSWRFLSNQQTTGSLRHVRNSKPAQPHGDPANFF